MSFDALGELNWLAVLAGTLAYFFLGALWYSPIFLGKPWMRATGMQEPAEGEGPGPAIYLAPLVSCLVSAIATGMLAEATGTDSVGEGLVLGLVVGIGYAVALSVVAATFEVNKPAPWTWASINASYHLAGLVLVGVILGAWD